MVTPKLEKISYASHHAVETALFDIELDRWPINVNRSIFKKSCDALNDILGPEIGLCLFILMFILKNANNCLSLKP